MKKKLSIFIAVALIFTMCFTLFIGCGNETTNNQDATEDEVAPPADDNGEAAPQEDGDVIQINVWTWEGWEGARGVNEAFEAANPGREVVFTNVQGDDMPMRLQTTLASGGDMPQIVWLIINQRGRLFDLGIWEDLSASPYYGNPDDHLPFMMPVHSYNGTWHTVEVSTPVAGIIFRRSLLNEFLGTDDPEEFASLINTWEDMYEFGLQVRDASGGEMFLFSALGELGEMLYSQRPIQHVVDGRLNIEESLGPVLEQLIRFYSAGIIGPMNTWTPEWNASFNESVNIFNAGPTWYPSFVIEMNGIDTYGDWALAEAPEGGFLMGGTGIGIPSAAENKEAAWEYLQWMYLSRDGAVANLENQQYLTAYAPAWSEEGFFENIRDSFGGQDIGEKFTVIAQNMAPVRPVSIYDGDVMGAFGIAVMTIVERGGDVTVEELLNTMREELVAMNPELE